MDTHTFGELRLDRYSPPIGATGLITREEIYKDQQEPSGWLGRIFHPEPAHKTRYFIFLIVRGSHDYRKGGETVCGGYEAHLGYWHYDSEKERDDKYDKLIAKGYSEHQGEGRY